MIIKIKGLFIAVKKRLNMLTEIIIYLFKN